MDKVLVANNRKLWADTLRSGRYQQGTGSLKNNMGYCCLGVAQDILSPGEWRSSVFPSDAYPSQIVVQCLALTRTQLRELTDLNDLQGRSFAEIATFIEKMPFLEENS